jgi:hypothetical protein
MWERSRRTIPCRFDKEEIMGDLICARCGEPWDSYGVFHGDMTEEEKRRFLHGEGCPSCFGVECQGEHLDTWAESMVDNLSDGFDGDPMELF